ncbi:D-2-hydroxyacid dehydrogenase family protein [soil metagenome]
MENTTPLTAAPVAIAVLDDYQNVALDMADWSSLGPRAAVTVFNDHIADTDALIARLEPFDVVCVMRERTPLSADILERLPRLKLIASTGPVNRAVDVAAAEKLGKKVVNTGYESTPTIEMTWALILGVARHIASENASVREGGWQRSVGSDLRGKTLSVLGLGRVGSRVAAIGRAFEMKVLAWSQNLTADKAEAVGAVLVGKEELFRRADFLSVHLILSKRTTGLVGAAELATMKKSAYLINTSRGPIVDEAALIEALQQQRLAGAAIDVHDVEPLPAAHPFRTLPNVLATPHIGYVSRNLYQTFYGDSVRNIKSWMDAGAVVPE